MFAENVHSFCDGPNHDLRSEHKERKCRSGILRQSMICALFPGLFLLAACGRTGIRIEKSEADTAASSMEVPVGTDEDTESVEESSSESATIAVYVCGAVVNEGVYTLPRGSRTGDALQAAGGYSDSAGRGEVNLARVLGDGEMIRFPTKEEAETGIAVDETGGTAERENGPGSQGRININTAGADELKTLSGIGEARAEEIIRYREKNGPFRKPEDLMKVPGIKEGTFRKFADRITTE